MKSRHCDFGVLHGKKLVAITPTLTAAKAVRRLYAGDCYVVQRRYAGDTWVDEYVLWPTSGDE